MSGINIPQRKGSGAGMGNLMTLAGGAAGAFFGGPAGAAAGMSAGGALGGMMQKPESEGPAPIGGGDAVSRRKAQLDQTPLRNIRESIDSLQYIQDPAQRAELAKPLLQADYMARMKA